MSSRVRFHVALALAASSALAASAFVLGCATVPDEAPDYEEDESNVTDDSSPGAVEDPSAQSDDEEPYNPPPAGPVVDPEDPDAVDDAGAPPDPPPDADPPPAPVTKKASCTSTYGSHRSVSNLTWEVAGSNALIKSLTVKVTNSSGRDKNDVDVWVRPPGGSEYKAFNSGDILVSGKTVSVKLPANWKKPLSTRIRIETNYDQSGSDPSASCSITLSK